MLAGLEMDAILLEPLAKSVSLLALLRVKR